MKPTDEQQAAIDASAAGRSIALEALAGTGKSSTLKMIARALPPSRRVLLTAFSAQVIKDAKAANFPGHVRAQGNHSLAYAPVGAAYRDRGRMERRLTPRAIVECLSLSDRHFPGDVGADEGAHLALEAVLKFQQSSSPELTLKHVVLPGALKHNRDELTAMTLKLAHRIWGQLSDLKANMPITHDTYLKIWALSKPRLPYPVVMVDESQDANAVIIDVLARQQAQMIVVGDRRQQIFSFRGAVNAMSKFKVDGRFALTQSFRFGNAVAQAANAVLAGHCGSGLRVRGFEAINDRISRFTTQDGVTTVVARKNATLMEHVVGAIDGHKRVGVVGGVHDLLWLVQGAEKLANGMRAMNCADLADFRDWSEVKRYAKTDAGRDLSVLVQLVDEYGTHRLQAMLRSVEGNEAEEGRCELLLTTAHRAKGREWDRVVLADDFPVPSLADLEGGSAEEKTKWTPEEANLLYVAVTRAKRQLNCLGVEAWSNAFNRAVACGIELPGLSDNPDLFTDEGETGEAAEPPAGIAAADLVRELLSAAEAGKLGTHLRNRANLYLASQ